MIVVCQVENVGEYELVGMMIPHRHPSCIEGELVLDANSAKQQPSRMLCTSLKPVSMPCIVKIVTTETQVSHRCFLLFLSLLSFVVSLSLLFFCCLSLSSLLLFLSLVVSLFCCCSLLSFVASLSPLLLLLLSLLSFVVSLSPLLCFSLFPLWCLSPLSLPSLVCLSSSLSLSLSTLVSLSPLWCLSPHWCLSLLPFAVSHLFGVSIPLLFGVSLLSRVSRGVLRCSGVCRGVRFAPLDLVAVFLRLIMPNCGHHAFEQRCTSPFQPSKLFTRQHPYIKISKETGKPTQIKRARRSRSFSFISLST